MKIPVRIERLPEGRFRASIWDVVAEGENRDEACQRLEESLHSSGKEVGVVDLPSANPWLEVAGIFEEDPLFEEWQEAIREYRRRAR